MTQTPPQERQDKGQFVQYPLHLIYGTPELTRDDKWVLLAIMGDCWTNGPYRLSYREIASIAKVPLSLLSSYEDKNGVHHEGIMERIERVTGYIHVAIGKEIHPTTGKPRGNAQSYITINYARIWQDNLAYCGARRQKNNTPQDYQPVSNTNRLVSNTNTSVQNENEPVSYANGSVSNTNEPVYDLPSNDTTYITKITKTEKTEREQEESIAANIDTSAIASSLSFDALSLNDNHSYCFFCSETAELTCRVCGKGVCYDTHGRRFPLTETDMEDYCLSCLDAHNAAVTEQIRIAASTTPPEPAPSVAGADSDRRQESEGEPHGLRNAHRDFSTVGRDSGSNHHSYIDTREQATGHQVLAPRHQSVADSEQDATGEHRQPPTPHRESTEGQITEGEHHERPDNHPSGSSNPHRDLEGADHQGQDGTLQASAESVTEPGANDVRHQVWQAVDSEKIQEAVGVVTDGPANNYMADLAPHHGQHLPGVPDSHQVERLVVDALVDSDTLLDANRAASVPDRVWQAVCSDEVEPNEEGQDDGQLDDNDDDETIKLGAIKPSQLAQGDTNALTRLPTHHSLDSSKPGLGTDLSQTEATPQAHPIAQTSPHEEAPTVAVSLHASSTVEPGHGARDIMPVAPVTDTPSPLLAQSVPPTSEQAALGSLPELSRTDVQATGQEGKKPTKPRQPKEVKPEPTPDEIALQERCRKLYNRIVEWRGYAFDLKGAIINERTYVKKLAMKYASDELIEEIYIHLTTKDFKWSKPSFRFKVGAYELFTEAPSVIQQMKLNGSNGKNGNQHDDNMVEWNGRQMTKDEASKEGYLDLGGWERYKGQVLPDGRNAIEELYDDAVARGLM